VTSSVHVNVLYRDALYDESTFLADHTTGRAIATLLRRSSVTLYIVAKRCVLEQKLLF